MARTPKDVEDRREQILEAAMRVFAQKGFAGATNKDVARKAGITPGLIYHYFDSKYALLRAIIQRRSPAKAIQALPQEVLAQPPEHSLRFLVRQLLSLAESEPFVHLIRVFLPAVIHNPKLASVGLPSFREAVRFVQQVLASHMERGALRRADPALTTQVLVSTLMGFVLRRQVLRDPAALRYTREQIAESVVTTTLHGLLPR